MTITADLWDQYGGVNLITSNITWQTSDTSLATIVANGRVATITTGTHTGTVIITASGLGIGGGVLKQINLNLHGCSMTTSPSGTVNTYGGGAVVTTTALACTGGETAPAGNYVWSGSGPLWIVNDNSQQSQVHINTTGNGTATARACTPAGVGRTCSPYLTLKIFGTSVTPLTTGTQNVSINSSGSFQYRVTNISPIAGTASVSCAGGGPVSCTSLSHSSVTLQPGAYQDVTASWATAGMTGAGQLTVNSTGFGGGGVDFSVSGAPLTVSIANGPTSVKPNVECEWDGTANGGTSPYTFNWWKNAISSIGTGPNLFYTNTGSNFTLYLDVTDALGATATTSQAITISSGAPACAL